MSAISKQNRTLNRGAQKSHKKNANKRQKVKREKRTRADTDTSDARPTATPQMSFHIQPCGHATINCAIGYSSTKSR